MAYDLVQVIKGAHVTYAVLGSSIALTSGMTACEDAKALVKAEPSNSFPQNSQTSKPREPWRATGLVGLAMVYAYLAYLMIAILGLKLYRIASRRD